MSKFRRLLAIRGEVLTNLGDGTSHWFRLRIKRSILD